jgi:hypothetical protein
MPRRCPHGLANGEVPRRVILPTLFEQAHSDPAATLTAWLLSAPTTACLPAHNIALNESKAPFSIVIPLQASTAIHSYSVRFQTIPRECCSLTLAAEMMDDRLHLSQRSCHIISYSVSVCLLPLASCLLPLCCVFPYLFPYLFPSVFPFFGGDLYYQKHSFSLRQPFFISCVRVLVMRAVFHSALSAGGFSPPFFPFPSWVVGVR